jgi:hypothetical protein
MYLQFRVTPFRQASRPSGAQHWLHAAHCALEEAVTFPEHSIRLPTVPCRHLQPCYRASITNAWAGKFSEHDALADGAAGSARHGLQSQFSYSTVTLHYCCML